MHPNYSIPAGNTALTPEHPAEAKATYPERRRVSIRSGGGSPYVGTTKLTMEVSPEERREDFEKRWQLGGVLKIRAVIDDPQIAELLIPDDHPIGAKRICADSNYFQTFNRPDVKDSTRSPGRWARSTSQCARQAKGFHALYSVASVSTTTSAPRSPPPDTRASSPSRRPEAG